MSYYERNVFIMGNKNQINEVMINPEVLFEDSEGQKINASYPKRFYFNDFKNNNIFIFNNLTFFNSHRSFLTF